MHLFITAAFDFAFLVNENICLKLTVVHSLFTSAVFTLNRLNISFCCSRYAAQHIVLLTSAASILGETWSMSSDVRKIDFFFFFVRR